MLPLPATKGKKLSLCENFMNIEYSDCSKVKCDKQQPCRTCQIRGHPEICTFAINSKDGGAQQDHRRKVSTARQPRIPAAKHSESASDITSPSGHDSVPAIISSKISFPNDGPLSQDVRAVLGLQNTLTSYLFTENSGQGNPIDALIMIAPRRGDVVKYVSSSSSPNTARSNTVANRYYQHYRTHVAPFSPILIEADKFELDISAYLKAEATGELKTQERLLQGRWATREGVSFVALLLSVLASGAFFSDDERSTDLAQSFGMLTPFWTQAEILTSSQRSWLSRAFVWPIFFSNP